MKVAALVLAAGGSSRLGRPKQLLRYANNSLVRRTVEAAHRAGCSPILVVVGRDRAAIAAELANLAVDLLPNDSWESGIGTSIRAGMGALSAAAAVVILTCDQPYVSAELISRLIEQQGSSQREMVASSYAGTIGVPALFTHACFEKLLSLGNEQGAKALLLAQADEVGRVDFAEGAVDIDTPEDYADLSVCHQRNS